MKKALSLLLALTLVISTLTTNLVISTKAAPVASNLVVNGTFDDAGATARFPGALGAGWTTTTSFHQWFRATYGSDTINSKIITDPGNANNKIASAYQTALQGVTVTPGKTYRLTFSAKADYAFQKFNVAFADVTSANTNSAYTNLFPMQSATGTKTYLNGTTTVTENCSPLYAVNYPAGNTVQVALTTDKWVTYTLDITINDAYNSTQRNSTRFCALKFQAGDYSGTAGNAANVAFYLDNVSLYEVFPITTAAEDVGGLNGGYITTPATRNAAVGDSITVKAVPFSGNSFAGWYANGSLVSTNAEYTFTASDTASYIAKFSGSTLKYVPNSAPVTPDDIIATNNDLMISYPHFGTPVFTQPSASFNAEVRAPSSYGTTGWSAWVENEYTRWDCAVGTVTYGAANIYMGLKAGYSIPVTLPSGVSPELLTLVVKHGSDPVLRAPMSVSVVPDVNANFYMMDITDTHMGWNFDDTQTGNQSPTGWGLTCQALKTTGIRFLSHTGDISLYPLASKADNIKNMMIAKQLQYSGSTLPFVMTPGNHEYDYYVYPQASITTLTTYDADSDGIPEFDGLGRFDKDTCDSYFGRQDALMPIGSSFLLAKHDFYAYWGIPALITAMGNAWNAAAPNYNYRLLLEHTHNDSNQSLFSSPSYASPTPYPSLEMKGHDHAWTINQTTPYRVLSVGGGAWEGGSGALVNFTNSSGNWSSPADSGTWTKATTQSKLINDARYNSPSVKINDTYANKNDGTATSNVCTIKNDVNFNFFDGRIRFVMAKGTYSITNGTVLSQYDSADGTKTVVLTKVNIPASGSVSVTVNSTGTVVNSTATFDSQGGSAVASQTVQAGTTISAPADPTRQGYTFNGWFTAATGGTKITFPYTVASDVTLYAQWTAIPTTYTVTYDSQGGSTVAAQIVNIGSSTASPADPTKSGYTFNGWFTAATGGSKITFAYTPTTNVTLYAQWTAVVVTGNLLKNGDFETPTGVNNSSNGESNNNYIPGLYAPPTTLITDTRIFNWYRAGDGNASYHDSVQPDPVVTGNHIGKVAQTLYQAVALGSGKTYKLSFRAKADTITGTTAAQNMTIMFVDITAANAVQPNTAANVILAGSVGGTIVNSQGVSAPDPVTSQGTNIQIDSRTYQDDWYTYNITFKVQDGGIIEGHQYAMRLSTNSNYSTSYWHLFVDDFNLSESSVAPVNYTVTYDSAGGATVSPVTVASGTAISAPVDPTKQGYTFNGWFTAATGGTKVTFPYTVSSNVTLYAQWTEIPVSYTVTFDTQGGSTVASKTVNSGTAITAPTEPTKQGYTFAGWFTAATNGTRIAFPYTVSSNATLYAQWTPVPHTVTYISEGGSAVTSQTVPYYTVITAPADPNKTGYTFDGWFTQATGGTKINFPYTVTDDITLHAQWTAVNYTVTFDSQGGSAVDSKTAAFSTTITAPADPTRTGYSFDGWYTAATDGVKVTFPYPIAGDVTLYARWTVQTTHTPGDVNNDGAVDLMDSTILYRYTAGWSGLHYNDAALDINGDGKIDLLDATTLNRFIAGWSVTIK